MINTKRLNAPPLIILLCLYLYSVPILAQNQALNHPSKQLNVLQNLKPQEKLYLHTDRSGYIAGDRVWLKAYYTDATSHKLIKSNTLMYLELIDQQKKIVLKRYIKITNGVGNGDFKIPRDQSQGEYVIRAYTRYMQNFAPDYFFTKKIKLLSIKEARVAQLEAADNQKRVGKKPSFVKPVTNKTKLDVQFFPEGGYLIDDLANQVAIKAVNQDGLGVNVQGKIIDSKGKELIRFYSVKFGMGKFMLVPKNQEKYTAVIVHQGKKFKFKLPESKPIGYKMQITSTPAYVQIMARVSNGYSVENCSIVAHVRGHIVSEYTYKLAATGFVFRIPKKDLPTGILHLTLFDKEKQPQCERLVFIEKDQALQKVKVTSPKTSYTHRQKAVFNLELKDANGKPIKGNASLAIVRDDLEADQSQKMNIQNYLWLKSDLRGRIENPAYYFNPQNLDRYQIMDLLMMTQGWRRFKWNTLSKMVASPLKYQKEEGFTISGQLLKWSNPKISLVGKVQFTPLEDVRFAGEVQTDKNGRFILKNLQIEDTINLVMSGVRVRQRRSGKIKEKRNNILLRFDGINPVTSAIPDNFLESASTDFTDEDKVLSHAYKIQSLDPSVIALKEVKITRRRPERVIHRINLNAAYSVDFTKVDPGILNASLTAFDVLRFKMPRIRIAGIFPFQQVVIRRSGIPLYLVDNIPVDAMMFSSVPLHDIAFVDLFNVSQSAIFGARAYGGALAMYTKQALGWNKKNKYRYNSGVINIAHVGYSKAREFYAPKYASQNIPKSQPDYRSILYWEPSITLDKNGKAKVAFFTSDETANYRIEVEGISDKGKVILGTYNFEVK